MVVLNAKVKASTLIEVLVAMVIILVIYGIAMMIFLNVQKSSNTTLKTAALIELENFMIDAKKNFSFIDEEYKTENFIIKKKCSSYTKSIDLRELSFEVLDLSGKLIVERRELIKLNINP